MKYKTHIEKNSLYNTCGHFQYIHNGACVAMDANRGLKSYEQNRKKLRKSDIIDNSEFYKARRQKNQVDMNITFRLPSEELEKQL